MAKKKARSAVSGTKLTNRSQLLKTVRAYNKKVKLETEQQQKFYRVAERVASGESINKATKAEHLSKTTFRKMNEERHNVVSAKYKKNKSGEFVLSKKTGRAIRAGYELKSPDKGAVLFVNSEGNTELKRIEVDKKGSSILGSYWIRIDQFRSSGTLDMKGVPNRVISRDGTSYRLLKDPDTIVLYLKEQGDYDAFIKKIYDMFDSNKTYGKKAA